MGLRTPLFAEHERLKARIVPFGGWDMPLHYGSQIEEHHAVRREAGIFDVSHMRRWTWRARRPRTSCAACWPTTWPGSRPAARRSTVACSTPQGGVVDDLIVYLRDAPAAPPAIALVVNAGTADKDLAWMRRSAPGASTLRIDRRGPTWP